MRIQKIQKIIAACALILLFGATACGGRDNNFVTGQYYYPSQDETSDETEDESKSMEGTETGEGIAADAVFGADAFIITQNDMQEECLILEQINSGKQYMYFYSITTQFLDKYGNRATVSDFEPGRVMVVGKKDIQGRLLQAQLSDLVWEYPNVTRFSVDEERGIFTIADTNYSYDEDLYIHMDGETQKLSDLTDMDTLRIVGVDKKILSISVTTGHGTLQLENTEIFEGSFIQIGSKIFSEITRDMEMELPAGTYMVAVANDGYGGSTEVEINGGKETILDLDTLKGEGPKMGNILFAVDVEGAIVQIDGKAVDYSKAVPIQYGLHTLTVTAGSYDTYTKKLFVNSEKATIVIGLAGEGTSTTTTADTSTDTDKEDEETSGETGTTANAGGLAGSLAGSHSSAGTSSGSVSNATSEAELDAIVDSLLDEDGDGEDDSAADYLSTLTELLSSLSGTNASE